jgi:uncharacterized protein (DUF4415 family)
MDTPERIVRYKRKPLTEEQIARLKAVTDLPDDRIDFLDIPEASEAFFERAVRGPMFVPVKRQTTLRLDADILDWFKRQGEAGSARGYQTRINQALRDYVTAQQRKAAGKRAG